VTHPPRLIQLQEFRPVALDAHDLGQAEALALVREFGSQIKVEPPTLFNGQRWILTAQGWVGHIPLTPALHLALAPKVALGRLFRMLELVYFQDSIRFLDQHYAAASVVDFYERLAGILATGVLNRWRRGIYRAYEPHADDLPYVRGRLDTTQMLRRPWRVDLPCAYEEHTADIEDNQLVAWTLQRILRSGLCGGRTLPALRAAHRRLQGATSPVAFPAQAALHRLYTRLNADYAPLHALCYFFLSGTGPTHHLGERTMLPFLVDMDLLFERYVARRLQQTLAPRYTVKIQERQELGTGSALTVAIDLVVEDPLTGAVRWVLDTKYKAPEGGPSHADINQAVTYATLKGAPEAVLIYPTALAQPLDTRIGPIRVRSLTFALDGDLDEAGSRLVAELTGAAWALPDPA
jgi:5-methylcytosine-specific restriction enzyme subunit McrC